MESHAVEKSLLDTLRRLFRQRPLAKPFCDSRHPIEESEKFYVAGSSGCSNTM